MITKSKKGRGESKKFYGLFKAIGIEKLKEFDKKSVFNFISIGI